MKISLKEILNEPINIYTISETEKRFLIYLSIFSFLFLLPIILGDFLFLDDYERSVGTLDWNFNGRLFQTFFYKILSFNVLNISPFTQILGMIMLIFSGFLIYKKLFAEISPFIASIITFIFIANPFFLENLAFKFDSLGMCLAVMLSVMSFYLGTYKNSWSIFLSVIFLILSLLTYQSLFLIMVGLTAFYFIKLTLAEEPNDFKSNVLWLGKMALVACIAYLLYYFISKPFIVKWMTIVYAPNNTFEGFLRSYTDYKNLYVRFFSSYSYIICFFIPFIIALISNTFNTYDFYNKRKKDSPIDFYKIISLIILFAFPLIIFAIASLNMILIANQDRPRTFSGSFLLLLFIFVNFHYFLAKVKLKNLSLLMIYPAIILMVNSYSFSNLQKSVQQDLYNTFEFIADDLRSLNMSNTPITLVIDGNPAISKQSKKLQDNLNIKYPIPYTDIWFMRTSLIANHDIIFNLKEVIAQPKQDLVEKYIQELRHFKPTKTNKLYELKVKDDIVVVRFL